jgi:hypothetical protein
MNRRIFLTHSFAASALGAGVVAFGQNTASPVVAPTSAPPPGTEPKRGAPFDVAKVKEFVGAGHGNLPRVKEMLAEQPRLVLASYDWGAGDFETALGGASHTGRREVALPLLDAGARIDAFCAAMLGETDIVTSLVRFSPATASTRGPHGYTLLYHAGYSGKVAIAEAIVARLENRARDCNQALQTASQSGHTEFVAWLLKNGADDLNTKNFAGKTPLDLAMEKGHNEIAKLLRDAGGLKNL